MKLRFKKDKYIDAVIETVIIDTRSKEIVTKYKSKSLAGVFDEIRLYEYYSCGNFLPQLKDMDSFDKLCFSNHINEYYSIEQKIITTKTFKAGDLK
jgi:hypothetical protein